MDTEDIGYSRLTPKATRYSFDWWRILKRVHAGAAAVGNPLAAVVLARLPASSADASAMRYAVALLVVSTVRLAVEGTVALECGAVGGQHGEVGGRGHAGMARLRHFVRLHHAPWRLDLPPLEVPALLQSLFGPVIVLFAIVSSRCYGSFSGLYVGVCAVFWKLSNATETVFSPETSSAGTGSVDSGSSCLLQIRPHISAVILPYSVVFVRLIVPLQVSVAKFAPFCGLLVPYISSSSLHAGLVFRSSAVSAVQSFFEAL